MSRLTAFQRALLLFVGALVLRLVHIGDQSLWIDEVYSLQQLALPWSALLLPGGYDEIHPPGYYLLVKPLYEFASPSSRWFESILRLPSAVFSALGLWAGRRPFTLT